MTRVHPKVKAGAHTASYAALITWIVASYNVTIPPEAAVGLAGLLSFVVQYLAK